MFDSKVVISPRLLIPESRLMESCWMRNGSLPIAVYNVKWKITKGKENYVLT